ncbi:Inward rectifier potassium channel 2 [Hondaea fermentalgiana]|uniref:Inward rectifier potassium channel 2 n=1 Tax=Hondaea fermentalgiana TaxID=2315210 RepID=A0A2R5GAV5_9STRA|nr:Inward rectifier potassium channel 2 [Hondaea fermentalgiana]|eukprot:GBG24824.1 Inward rectifier potassium channel 2 [Hondaea fermentalgiana]
MRDGGEARGERPGDDGGRGVELRNLEEAVEAMAAASETDVAEASGTRGNNSATRRMFRKTSSHASSAVGNPGGAPSTPPATTTTAERDFIDSDPVYGAGYRPDDETSSYGSSGYGSDEFSDPYGELEDAGCFTRLCFRLHSGFTRFRWKIRNVRRSSSRPGRLLDRDNAFHQSSGRLHISQVATGRTAAEIFALYSDDWFHVMLSLATWQLMLLMLLIYTTNLLVFAGFYMAVDRPEQSCGLTATASQAVTFQTAFAFSLITSSTIGYGFPSSSDPFFHDCVSLVVVVYLQVIVSLAINALVVGLVLQRLGRADSRSHQVVFSDKACIRCIHGHFYFMFQVYDLDRRHPVVEAHVRVYAVFHETDGAETVHFQTRYMRLQNPNDELGGVLFLSVPCTVVHCIDQWSPLMPPSLSRLTWENDNDDFVHNSSNRYIFPGLILREADTETGDRDGTSCPVCGETFPTDQHLLRHIRYQQWEERANGLEPVLDRNLMDKLFPDDDSDIEMEGDEDEGNDNDENGNGTSASATNTSDGAEGGDAQADANSGIANAHSNVEGETGAHQDEPPVRSLSEPRRRMSTVGRLSTAPNRREHRRRVVHHGKRVKVSRILRFYANLDIPIGHQDVDMNLLQTEYELVPDREDATAPKAPNDTDVFAMFEEMERSSRMASRASSGPATQTPSEQPALSRQGSRKKANMAMQREDLEETPAAELHPAAALSDRKFRRKAKSVEAFRKYIEEHVKSSGIEIIVLVEGIEARSSNTFQARHSYTSDNIEFNKFFTPAMKVSPYGHAQVNLNSFHQTIPVPSHVEEIIGMSHT